MSPTVNGSSALQRFERSNAIEIRNGIMFNFYPGLPHIILSIYVTARNTTCCHTFFHQPNITKSWTNIDLYPKCRNILYSVCLSARVVDNPAKRSHGIRTYNKYAKLRHLPRVLIKESSTPRLAAVETAPILKKL